MADSMAHLVIGTPCYGSKVTGYYAQSLITLKEACYKRGGVDFTLCMILGDALIPRARQDIVSHFLANPQATHLLFIDADIGFEPEQVFRLLDFNRDIVAGVYPVKRIDWDKVESMARAGVTNLKTASLSYVVGVEDPKKIHFKDGFAQVRYAGTGFMMIKRRVLEKMTEHYPQLRYNSQFADKDPLKKSPFRYALFNCLLDEKNGTYLSEDFSFCQRWIEMGGEIWADLTSRLTHVGLVAFEGDMGSQLPPTPKGA
jgi:hypothetical protein